MEINIDFLKRVALTVYDRVHPLLGTAKAAEEIKKGAGGDISLYIDLVAENTIIEALKKNNSDVLLISEEIGVVYIGNKNIINKTEYKLIVDPVDGSLNSMRGVPFCCCSIAVAKGTSLEHIVSAVIVDLNSKDIYWAEKGKGAFLNDKPIRVSERSVSDQLLFEIDLDPDTAAVELKKFQPILEKLYRIRTMGSIALSFCMLASGKIDGFLNFRRYVRLMDMAASYLIVNEAGGRMFGKNGEDLDIPLKLDAKIPLIASNATLESFLRKELKKIENKKKS